MVAQGYKLLEVFDPGGGSIKTSGVKVYSVVMVLSSAGLHVPVIPFKDVVGKGANGSPVQIASIGAKFGVTIGFTTIVSV